MTKSVVKGARKGRTSKSGSTMTHSFTFFYGDELAEKIRAYEGLLPKYSKLDLASMIRGLLDYELESLIIGLGGNHDGNGKPVDSLVAEERIKVN
jgi:hypothetical protein